MEKETLIHPSLLSADFLHLSKEISSLLKVGITTIHFDVMDGLFVKDISFGEKLFKTLYEKYQHRLNFDVHLMTEDPFRHIRQFLDLGATDLTFHYENTINKLSAIKEIRRDYPYVKLGLAFSPETDVSRILGIAHKFDKILVMSVVPGASGQKFLPFSLEKIKRLNRFRQDNDLSYLIGVDGGVDEHTAPNCIEAGVDYLVTGSYFFSAVNKEEALNKLVRVKHEL